MSLLFAGHSCRLSSSDDGTLLAQVQRKERRDKEMRWERAPAVLGRHVDERCLAQAFKGIHAARRRPAKRPSTVTQRYFRRVLVKLGVRNPKVRWVTRDHCLNARPKLRRTTDTWLIDYVVWQVTQPAREKRFDHMLAVRRQLRKALSQMAPDEGPWTRARWVIAPESRPGPFVHESTASGEDAEDDDSV